jgi:hypothetical protein
MMPPDPQHVFDRLLGMWSFVRAVSGQAKMTGNATITLLAEGVAQYVEKAHVTLADGKVLHGEQRYLYRKTSSGFGVLFHETGELFHALTFVADDDGGLRASATHDCKADLYRSEYVVGQDGEFRVRHVVRGPRKDYAIETIYSREGW